MKVKLDKELLDYLEREVSAFGGETDGPRIRNDQFGVMLKIVRAAIAWKQEKHDWKDMMNAALKDAGL